MDWIGNNLYWTNDGYRKTISVARLERASQTRKTLLEGNMSHPRAIVVDPLNRSGKGKKIHMAHERESPVEVSSKRKCCKRITIEVHMLHLFPPTIVCPHSTQVTLDFAYMYTAYTSSQL